MVINSQDALVTKLQATDASLAETSKNSKGSRKRATSLRQDLETVSHVAEKARYNSSKALCANMVCYN